MDIDDVDLEDIYINFGLHLDRYYPSSSFTTQAFYKYFKKYYDEPDREVAFTKGKILHAWKALGLITSHDDWDNTWTYVGLS